MSDSPVGRPMGRLTVVDDLLLRDHRRSSSDPVVIQGLWVGDQGIPDEVIAGIHHRLATGRLGYRVRATGLPGARREWIAADARYPIDRTDSIDDRDLVRWADSRPCTDLDPAAGPGWRLSVADLASGGCVLAVTCSHALVDGRGLLRLLAERVPTGLTPAAPDAVTGDSDARDALRQWATVGYGTLRAVGGLVVSKRRRRQLRDYRALQPPRAADPTPTPTRTDAGASPDAPAAAARPGGAATAHPGPTCLIVEIDRARWDRLARDGGGTPNTAFVRAAGRIGLALSGRDLVTVGVAVDTRSDRRPAATIDDRTSTSQGSAPADSPPPTAANAVAMATVPVRPIDGQRSVRDRCRGAYAGAVAAPAGFPAELVQVLPDPIVDRMVPAPGRYDVLCSNLGEAPADLSVIGDVPARGIAGRALGPTGRWASVFVLGIGERYCVSVTARPGTATETLTTLVDTEIGPALRYW